MFGAPALVIDLAAATAPAQRAQGSILIGVDRQGRLPDIAIDDYDLLLTAAAEAPRGWIAAPAASLDTEVARLEHNARARPLAASTLAQVLRCGAALPLPEALVLESLAYSTLLAGPEFRAWREAHPVRPRPPATGPRVRLTRAGGALELYLAHPRRLNAFDSRMRDELVEALYAVAGDPSASALNLRGDGPSFSSGGDLDEFGCAADPATAHAIRCLRSPALLVHRLRERTSVYVHGACIGAGIEVSAAAGRVIAHPNSWFRLPEIGMGLIPGAGGTATLPRRIGRQRTLYWALGGERLEVQTALAWGLVDGIAEGI
ncbi:MAG: enoyl-CoA hydratase/isomerase family protein [Burkholderiales bacterium]|nr:enoyl-CoA hydratase/isomerase family protein [Burkholderiales bacterium]